MKVFLFNKTFTQNNFRFYNFIRLLFKIIYEKINTVIFNRLII